MSAGVAVGDRCAQGGDRNPRCEAREEEPGDTNPDRKYSRKRLLRHDIAITNCEAGDEGEIDRVADRPTLDKANQQAQGNLNRQDRRQDRPRDMNGVAQLYEKAAPHGLWWRPVHAHSLLGVSIDLATLAGVAGVSIHHFARGFKQSAGVTPHHYLTQKRVERAQDLLAHTDLSLSEIAYAVGFSDQSHLARHFRQVLGVTPGQFRWAQR
jgi:AraC-like DNA-binding protein